MRKFSFALFVVGLMVVLIPAFGQKENPWVGTWKFVSGNEVSDPPNQMTLSIETNALHSITSINMSRQEWTARKDGQPYTVTVNPAQNVATQITLNRLEIGIAEMTTIQDGKRGNTRRFTVSADGQELTSSLLQDSKPIGNVTYWTRSGKMPDPQNPLAGKWNQDGNKNLAMNPQPTLRIEAEGDDGIQWSRWANPATLFHSQFDGKEHPADIVGHWWKTITSKRIDDRTLEMSGKGATVGATTIRLVMSADGREITFTEKGVGSAGNKYSSERKYRKQ